MTMQGGIACECCWVLVNWGGVHRGSVPKPYLDILPAGGKADLLCRSKTAVDYDASTKHEDPNRSVDVAAAGDEDTSDDKPMEEDLAKMTLGSDFDMDREYLWLDELPVCSPSTAWVSQPASRGGCSRPESSWNRTSHRQHFLNLSHPCSLPSFFC
eukprot:gene21995-biopygen1874